MFLGFVVSRSKKGEKCGQLAVLFLLLLLAALPAPAQSWELLDRLEAEQQASGIVGSGLAPNGDVVVAGVASGTFRLGPTLRAGDTGYTQGFVARRSQAGQWLWATTIRSPNGTGAHRVLVLPDNDVLVLGTFTDGYAGASFGTLPTLFGDGTYDGYVGRLNGATGQWRWVAQLAGHGGFTHVRPNGLALRPNGELVVVGNYDGELHLAGLPPLASSRPGGGFGTVNYNVFVARLNPATGQWLQVFGAGGLGTDDATDVVSLPGGDIALAGSLQAPLTLGGLPAIGGAATPRAFVARLDPVSGSWRWVQQAQADVNTEGQRLAQLPAGDLVLSGKYAGTVRMAPFALGPGPGPYGTFVGRLRADTGQWQWAAAGGGTGRPMGQGGLTATPGGDVLITSTFSETGRFGALPPVSSRSKDPDIFVGQLSGNTGQWQWLGLAGGTGGSRSYTFAGDDFAGSVHALSNQQLLVTGTFSDVTYLGPAIGPLATRLSDGFIARITVPAPCPDSLAPAPAGLRVVADSTDCAPGRTLRVAGAPAGSGLTWSTGSTEPTIRAVEAGSYSVLVSTLAGCRFRLRYTLTAASLTPPGPIPNIITPNADGRNDRWKIAGLPAGTHLQVFSRWGRLVYESADYASDWTAAGLPAGTYYYVLSHPQLCPAPRLKGWVEVVR
ncbi:gliding motility-associated C-terminal domain-containing protein [Hymenobacter sp. M29]|uniref:Gliding motility-associated C-terminal domain-containing protein n=1 Tax=Hymenobacter mellowenesis TaxID=3063995 RepID=A0ABT9AG24_9BACT|nr:gliding motility-associated C-terminal domain-containing protein [Hymenobacter sp. M29]MDO7848832.1 gliding motility-associated C-terminal domain-containing protein [Hymenobacter sp. M29]